ncbi:nucleoside triphosphate pyrophosphohydrolase [Patescibacteria group bacterium]|nr:hypothetical protein [Candidatus Falkowbacteria bacterium]MBU3906103.1 nucleoside triphosphate pyrophosphohydrolase [Patescibacteria group bacterium]MBU4014688.1 nucleoside triphosphate pyrophosphohydrolase [Patescibacteria group bacterium]MBU4025969.1 nucleoside triphosphate pyrophosphohydrolase [Patescibacteria group bacterium]MBU4073151.1 nucleoside triphosphate pyrophosphohydrolase [Patescibacteria group bacterium]
MKKNYNKLVRDNIPEIIKADNCRPNIRKLGKQEYLKELMKKLKEEAEELINAKDNEKELAKEISDVYEVIDAIIDYYNLDKDKISEFKKERKEKRGGFEKRIFLESIVNDE